MSHQAATNGYFDDCTKEVLDELQTKGSSESEEGQSKTRMRPEKCFQGQIVTVQLTARPG